MSRRDEGGQVLALTVLMLGAMLGMSALVIDVGAWFHADRKLQATVDAAAAAGAQALPENPAGAVSLAVEYAGKNGGGVAPADVTVASGGAITVRGSREVPGFFSRVLDVFSVRVGARAVARAEPLVRVRGAAPIVVHEGNPLLSCLPEPCYGQETQLTLASLKEPGAATAAGAFGLVNYAGATGTVSTGVIADWLRDGYDTMLGPGLVRAATGAKFNSVDVRAALAEVVGQELLLPVYRSVVGTGQNADFEIVGWVGFVVSGWDGAGDSGNLRGQFRRLTWDGEGSAVDDASVPYFGAKTVALVG